MTRTLLTCLLFLLPPLCIIGGLIMTPLLFAFAVLLALPHWREWRWGRALRHPAGPVILLLLCWPLLRAPWSIIPAISFTTAARMAGLMAAGALLCAAARKERVTTAQALAMPLGILLVSFLICADSLPGGGPLKWLIGGLHLDYEAFREKQVNRGLCTLAVLIWPAVLGLLSLRRTLYAFILPLALLPSIFLLHSLSAKAGLCAGIAVFYAVTAWPVAASRALYVALPLCLILWPLGLRSLESGIRNHPAIYNVLPESSKHRLDIWRFVRDHIDERPWAGWGMDASRAIPGGNVVYAPGKVYLPLHPHNNVLQVLLEQGVIGFGLSLLALACVLRLYARLPKHATAARATAASMLVSYLLMGMTAFGMWQSWWVATAWLAVGLWVMQREAVDKTR